MFNLFDEDGNGSINVEELLNMMAFFIEIGRHFINELKSMFVAYIKFCIENSRSAPIVSMTGADAGSVDLATVMAEMFQSGDRSVLNYFLRS